MMQVAFRNCKNLEEIILPSTIKVIGTSAFEGCTNVKRIIIRSISKDERWYIDRLTEKGRVGKRHARTQYRTFKRNRA